MLYCVFNQINAALVSRRDFFQKHKHIFWLHTLFDGHFTFMYTCCVFRKCLYILYINVPDELFLSVVCWQWCHESRGDGCFGVNVCEVTHSVWVDHSESQLLSGHVHHTSHLPRLICHSWPSNQVANRCSRSSVYISMRPNITPNPLNPEIKIL